MGLVTTYTEGRVVTHSSDDAGSIEVVQLPARDAAVQSAAAAEEPTATATTRASAAMPPVAGKTMHARPPALKKPTAAKKRSRA
jgi:hypothetical protein